MAARAEGIPTIVEVMEVLGERRARGWPRAVAGAWPSPFKACSPTRSCAALAASRSSSSALVVKTMYPGISPAYAEGNGPAFREAHGLVDASPLIVIVGNVIEGRAHDVAIRALGAVRQRHLGPSARSSVARPDPRTPIASTRGGCGRWPWSRESETPPTC
jgi:hypothetical protein